MASNLSRAARNVTGKSQQQRLLEAHPWWEKVMSLSRDVLDGSVTLPELIARLQALYADQDYNDVRDERSRITAELARRIAYRLPQMIARDGGDSLTS